MTHKLFGRRSFLQTAGVCIALPAFESLTGRAAMADQPNDPRTTRVSATNDVQTCPRRMVCIGNEFGFVPRTFWPGQFGRNYELTPLLRPLQPHRQDLTIFSHLDHDLKGGHFAVHTFLTGVKAEDARNIPNVGISLDQRAAQFVGSRTRFPSLTIGSEGGLHGGPRMSWKSTGTRVPPIQGPRELYRALFVQGDARATQRTMDRIARHGSILDAVLEEAGSMRRRLNQSDRDRLDQYFASIRDAETKLRLDRHWQNQPKPTTTIAEPTNQGLARDLPALYELIALALQTDSARVATLEIGGSFLASDLGIRRGYHALSHHGHLRESLDLLFQVERYQVQQFAAFLAKLKSIRQANTDETLLDSTMVLMGSGMGNGNSHTNFDLPIILAGGGFRHGEYKQYPSEKNRRVPLSNLYVSMLQRFGVETDRFSRSTGTLTGFEVA
ncbi:MAG: DUF1552 domain-containing protein [Gemmataceae bacterium]